MPTSPLIVFTKEEAIFLMSAVCTRIMEIERLIENEDSLTTGDWKESLAEQNKLYKKLDQFINL